MIPSTTLLLNSVDMRITLDVSAQVISSFPFFGLLHFSFSELPKPSFGEISLSRDNGLQGIDLISLPLINTWIHKSIQDVLLAYVTPNFVSFDLPYWLASEETSCCKYMQDQRGIDPNLTQHLKSGETSVRRQTVKECLLGTSTFNPELCIARTNS
mmetsp:Transcript_27929/g.32202  ORF Transcript_27929/g.32202 Transcript_27929/m.32202 type:complete len:156 (-) Transcript_27929:49-516(-)